jgi:hypothetical protein
MGSARLSRFGRVCGLFCLSLGVASAGNFAFNGVFTQDDQHEVFTFTAPSATVTLRSYGYGGGTNVLGGLILPGGFDPQLSLFDSTGGLGPLSPLVDANGNGTCGTTGILFQTSLANDPATTNCFDSFLLLTTLSPTHQYTLVLTQEDNVAIGATYGDGFTEDGNAGFTAAFGCGGTSFCDQSPAQRTGAWEVDITGVRTAVDEGAVAPEPGTVILLLTGCSGLLLLGRRRNSQRL